MALIMRGVVKSLYRYLVIFFAACYVWALGSIALIGDDIKSFESTVVKEDSVRIGEFLNIDYLKEAETKQPDQPLVTQPLYPGYNVKRPKLVKKKIQQPYWPVRQNIDCMVMRCVALTFDDGPSEVTPQLLDMLAEKKAVATFFLYGQFIHGREATLQKMIAGNNEIGNHSYTHKSFRKINAAEVAAEVNLTQDAVFAVTGYRPHIIRPPYGDVPLNDPTLVNYALIMWNNDPQDWNGKMNGSVHDRVMAAIRPGAIIVMHDLKPTCISSVPQLLDTLASQGYVTVTISELFNWRTPETPLPGGQTLYSQFIPS